MKLEVLDQKLRSIGDSFEAVNRGGCACVASMLANALRHEFPIMRITSGNGMFSSNRPPNINTYRNKIINPYIVDYWFRNGFNFDHLWVEILHKNRWYALDSTGIKPIKDMYERWGLPSNGTFTFDEIDALAASSDWNPTFNRSQIPAMQELISTMFH